MGAKCAKGAIDGGQKGGQSMQRASKLVGTLNIVLNEGGEGGKRWGQRM